jgi:hypothetical protein
VLSSIENIETLNPKLNAVVHKMYDRALEQAQSPVDGPFSGVPFMLKDLLSWYAGEPITSGSRFFKGWIPPYDTEMVKRYRRSGVIVVGKTNTPAGALRPDCKSMEHGSHHRRVVGRFRRRGRERNGSMGGRRRRWRIHSHPRIDVRNIRTQTHPRTYPGRPACRRTLAGRGN